MARTWPVTLPKRALFAALDAVGRPVASLVRRSPDGPAEDPRRILVLELWHMGDVVIATSVLRSLRGIYPQARITLLAKAHAEELLQGSSLVDEIVAFDFPWTAMHGKYTLGRYDRASIVALVKRLRAEKFDLSLDCRMDVRSNFLTNSIGARRRIGYNFGGGAFLLTDAIAAPPADQHKIDDWHALLEPLTLSTRTRPPLADPMLSIDKREREWAESVLRSHGIEDGDVIVGIHAGGSHSAKRWASDNFAEVGRSLSANYAVRLVAFIDPDNAGSDMQLTSDAIFVRTSIREMMALFSCCDFVVCNDSGPMHIAAALGVPVVAVFRTGNPSAYGPRGISNTVVGNGASREQVSDVSVDDVLAVAEAQVKRAIAARETRIGM